MKFSHIVVILLLCSVCGTAQTLLFQKNRYRQALYKPGDQIAFRLKGDKTKFSGKILGFEDSVIVFQGFKINPKNISSIYVDEKTRIWFVLRYKYARLFLFVGAGYILLDAVNTGEFKRETLIVGGSFIAAGLLAKLLISDRIKIKGRRKLVIIG